MAKKGRSGRGQRDASDIANSMLLSPTVTPTIIKATPVADRRTYNPSGPLRPALSFGSTVSRITVKDRYYGGHQKRIKDRARIAAKASQRGKAVKLRSQTKAVQAFLHPATVPLCVRRGIRREVLHALRKTGMAGSTKKRRRNFYSNIRC